MWSTVGITDFEHPLIQCHPDRLWSCTAVTHVTSSTAVFHIPRTRFAGELGKCRVQGWVLIVYTVDKRRVVHATTLYERLAVYRGQVTSHLHKAVVRLA